MSRSARAAAALTTVLAAASVCLAGSPAWAAPAYDGPVEDYASYQPQKRCREAPRPGTRELAEWIDARFGGGPAVASVRACSAHALARRMWIMYVIWNDHTWASYREFRRTEYVNGSCPRVATCSVTLRHRDHVHLSLSRAGGRADTSWYRRG